MTHGDVVTHEMSERGQVVVPRRSLERGELVAVGHADEIIRRPHRTLASRPSRALGWRSLSVEARCLLDLGGCSP